MGHGADCHLAEMAALDRPDRRNGTYERTLTTEVGAVVLAVKRTRSASAVALLAAYVRRAPQVDRAILDCFLLGASTRKVGRIMAPILGEKVPASTVSRIAKQLDVLVEAYHKRSLPDHYRFLLFDGVVLKRKSGAGAVKRVVLVALGITADGRKEVIDFYLAKGESQAAWEAFLNDLYRRGLQGDNTELIVTDGGNGLLAALPLVYPRLPTQRCWAHNTRNVLNKVRRKDQRNIKADLHKISHAKNLSEARKALTAFHSPWKARILRPLSAWPATPRSSWPSPHQGCKAVETGPHNRRHRTTVSIGAPENPPHGRLRRFHQHGAHPSCIYLRKPKPGHRHPDPLDTNIVTLPLSQLGRLRPGSGHRYEGLPAAREHRPRRLTRHGHSLVERAGRFGGVLIGRLNCRRSMTHRIRIFWRTFKGM